jgi:UMF1 family MFS transporter
MTLRYLVAYLIYNDGIQTVIVVAAAFATSELGVGAQTVLILVLMIQFVAFGGALLFGRIAARIGAKRAIMITLVIWSGVVIYAFAFLNNRCSYSSWACRWLWCWAAHRRSAAPSSPR